MQKILAKKLVNPEQVLDPIQNIALINCCKEIFMVLGNAGTRKGATINYLLMASTKVRGRIFAQGQIKAGKKF